MGNGLLMDRKTLRTMSPVLTHFLVSAWIEEKEGIGFFLVNRNSSGLSIKETWDVIAMRGTESHDLVLNNVEVRKKTSWNSIKDQEGIM